MADSVDIVELRVLDGPNLFFPRPAVKLTLAAPGWLRATETRLARLADEMALPGTARPGPRNSEQRRRFAARVGAHVTRTIARAARVRLAVRGRASAAPDQVVIAFPWRRRDAAEELARRVAAVMGDLLATRRSLRRLAAEAAEAIAAVDPGPAPTVTDPEIPVIAVTGTNGKTTTVRLLAHIVRSAGLQRRVLLDRRRLPRRRARRGGRLLGLRWRADGARTTGASTSRSSRRPAAASCCEASARATTTCRSSRTSPPTTSGCTASTPLDQLAEVKATITTITRPDGWHVLNADDPRVLGDAPTRRGQPVHVLARPASSGAARCARRRRPGPRGARPAASPSWDAVAPARLVDLEQVPMTLAGIASQHVHNAMSAAAAALAIGMPRKAVVLGLRTFMPDAEANPGRANVYALGDRVVVIDYAHNEAGIDGLAEIAERPAPAGRRDVARVRHRRRPRRRDPARPGLPGRPRRRPRLRRRAAPIPARSRPGGPR